MNDSANLINKEIINNKTANSLSELNKNHLN